MVCYPLLFYSGLTPDCQEIVIANLADIKKPQYIIKLPNDF